MLQAINDRIKGWLGMAIVALIALPFAFWGIQSYVTGGGAQYVAKVNDAEISARELDFNVSQQKQKLQQQYGGKLPFEENVLKRQVLEQLVNRKIIEGSTYDNGYRISDAQLSGNIKAIFTRDGQFDRDLFDRVLQSRGRSVSQFEYELRTEMRVLQMRDALVNTTLVTDEEARKLAALEDQIRNVRLVNFNVDSYTPGVIVTEEDINDAYETRAQQFMLPEKVSIEYVELTNDQLTADLKIDEQKINQMYDDYVASVSQKEKRKASHILLKTGDDINAARSKLQDIKQQLANGALFEDLARENSEDPGSAKQGGDLGWVEAGQMVKPFEDALFSMNKGEVGDIVESQFGLHLIKLVDVEGGVAGSLAEKRADFEKELNQEAASDMFYDMSESMATMAYENPDSLDAVIDATGLQLKTTELFTRDAGTGLAENDLVRKAAFSTTVLSEGGNSDIVELSPEHVVVLRMREHKPASLRPLSEVRSAIENGLKLKAGHERALAAAIDIKAKIEAGQAVESVLHEGLKVEKLDGLTRKDTSKVDPLVLEAVFNMPQPEAGRVVVKEVSTYTGDVALVLLDKITAPENIEQGRIDAIKNQWRQDVANREFDATLNHLKASADLYVNPRALQSEVLQ
jgi:peptidyl-prolyl cis-trans isomerase D